MSVMARPIERAMHYGDGLFETLRVVDGRAPLWQWHWQRLQLGCERLRLPLPDEARLLRRLRRLRQRLPDATVKLLWSAGSSARGYARPEPLSSRMHLYAAPRQAPPDRGLRLRWCEFRLGDNPLLAGIKHLNRLEQVMARSEWTDSAIDEGLMLDGQGHVIAATASNLLIRKNRRWITPLLDRCGVAGVGRRWCLQQLAAQEARIGVADVEGAEQCLLINAVQGPRPVVRLGAASWRMDAEVQTLQRSWNALFAIPVSGTQQ